MPGQPRMVRLRAQALAKGGKVAEANKLLEDGVAAYPDSREYLVGLADLYTDQKRIDEAVRLFEQARKTFGDDETLTMRVANAYEAGGRLDEAEREFRKLMAADPLNANAMNSLGYMLADRGMRLPEALELAQRAVKVEPDNPAYQDTLGWALFKSGKAAEAGRAAGARGRGARRQLRHPGSPRRRPRQDRQVSPGPSPRGSARSPVTATSIDRAAIEKKIKDARARRK